jgi:hypothetical protein
MAFTDEDLKRLKDAAKSERWEGSLVALIARLEAAERVCESIQSDNENPDERTVECLEVWHKSKELSDD